MLPYDFFMVLEKKGDSEPFRSNDNMKSLPVSSAKTDFEQPGRTPSRIR